MGLQIVVLEHRENPPTKGEQFQLTWATRHARDSTDTPGHVIFITWDFSSKVSKEISTWFSRKGQNGLQKSSEMAFVRNFLAHIR